MLSVEPRGVPFFAGDGEVPGGFAGEVGARTPLQVISSEALTLGNVRLPRRGPVVVTDEALREGQTGAFVAQLSLDGVEVLRPREYYERVLRRVMLEDLDESWFIFGGRRWRYRLYAWAKAAMDLVGGLIGSAVCVLLMPIIWIFTRFDDKGPLFYSQERVGLRGKPFRIIKFRTMRVDAESAGPKWASADDDRVTRIGRVLRQSHLDELPQFFNVMRREMSLIGPRPEREVFVRVLGRAIPFFDRRHLMRPGITGWAVVRFGYSDSVRDKWRIHEYDLYYLKHRSVLLDLEIMARTAWTMVTRAGQ